MSRSIKNVIKKGSSSYPIQRFDRDSGYFDDTDGLWVDDPETKTTLLLHIQPVKDALSDGVEGQRQLISWRGWAIDVTGNTVANKDVITIDEGLYTVSDLEHWPGVYREFNLIRSGEADNLDDT
jgi:hypothetical protein